MMLHENRWLRGNILRQNATALHNDYDHVFYTQESKRYLYYLYYLQESRSYWGQQKSHVIMVCKFESWVLCLYRGYSSREGPPSQIQENMLCENRPWIKDEAGDSNFIPTGQVDLKTVVAGNFVGWDIDYAVQRAVGERSITLWMGLSSTPTQAYAKQRVLELFKLEGPMPAIDQLVKDKMQGKREVAGTEAYKKYWKTQTWGRGYDI